MEYLLPSPLKINLTLRITGRRPDGFHDLYSVFLRLDGHESILIRLPAPGGDDIIRVYNYAITGQNIIIHTLESLRMHGFPSTPIEVEINKAVPPGTGLGGGSGNAAALVCWAREVYDPFLLKGLETTIGADVPFFCNRHALALAQGSGDRLEPLAAQLPVSVCVLIPKWRSDTGNAYRMVDRSMRGNWHTETQAADEAEGILSGLAAGERMGLLPNDFIPGLVQLHPAYETLFRILEGTRALAWGLSGSGSAVFGLYPKGTPKQNLADEIVEFPGIERILFWE